MWSNSTNQGSDVDHVIVGWTLPYNMSVDSVAFGYKTSANGDSTTGTVGYIDSLIFYQGNRTTLTNLADSACYKVDANLWNSTAGTRAVYYVNRSYFNAGDRFALRFRNSLKSDNGTVNCYYVHLIGKRY